VDKREQAVTEALGNSKIGGCSQGTTQSIKNSLRERGQSKPELLFEAWATSWWISRYSVQAASPASQSRRKREGQPNHTARCPARATACRCRPKPAERQSRTRAPRRCNPLSFKSAGPGFTDRLDFRAVIKAPAQS